MAMYGSGSSDDFMSFNFPTTALASFDDDDFLSLLQKHTKPLSTTQQAAVNPNPISTLPNPTITPPSSGTDESPSPPNVLQDHDSILRTPSTSSAVQPSMPTRTTRSSHRDGSQDILGKRKAPYSIDDEDDDDEDDHPPHKQQHIDATGASNKKSAKRKSSGTAQDEYRLQKRKEQNRAAQRAFRERKEKHVKDLEDKVAMLEAKTDTQAAENENLRELLTRLQNENVQLKQAQFNFTFQQSVPGASGSNTAGTTPGRHPSHSSQSPTEPVLTQNPTPPTSKSTPDIHLFDAFNIPTGDIGFSPPASNPPTTGTANGTDLSWLNMFGTFPNATNGASPNSFFNGGGMPYQTIASNPMFTSFREPTPNAWASFGAGPADVNMGSYDELFGGGGSTTSQNMNTSMEDLLTFNAFLPDITGGSSSVSPASQPGVASPSTHPGSGGRAGSNSSSLTLNSAHSGASTSGSSGQPSPHNEKDCPKSKSDFEAMIRENSQDTFGPPVPMTSHPSDASADLRCTITPADPTKVNLDLGTAWKAVRQHPQFEDCDIDALCTELAQKARCDGNNKVVEAQNIMDLVHSIPDRAQQRKAQQKLT